MTYKMWVEISREIGNKWGYAYKPPTHSAILSVFLMKLTGEWVYIHKPDPISRRFSNQLSSAKVVLDSWLENRRQGAQIYPNYT